MYKKLLLILLISVAFAGATTLVKDGKPAASLVLPEKPATIVKNAADDFIYHIERISGAKLPIATAAPEGGAIILTTEIKDSQYDYKPLGRNGFIIRNDGDNLVICATNGGLRQALYYLLEENFGVRWLWPGPLGELIIPSKELSIDGMDLRFRQPLPSSRWHTARGARTSYKSEKAWKEFYEQNMLWLDRLGFDWDTSIRSQHSFGHPGWKYGEKYWKTHPEYFNMLPDGTRRPDPYHVNGAIEWSSTCPSSEGLLQQVLKDWREKRAGGYPFGPNLFLGENDANGSCCCPQCLAADRSDDPGRLERAKKRFDAGDPKWMMELGHVTDRYMQFYLRGLAEAKKTDPNVKVIGWADYANYDTPPKYSKLNPDIILCFVGKLMYPWTDEKVAAIKESWLGWSKTGARFVFRPNFMLDGHCMPVNYARKLHSLYRFCLEHDMIGTEFDSNIGQFGGNGFNYYLLGRMTRHPELSFEQIQDEYCGAFGAAAPEIKEYLNYWEKISDSKATVDACNAVRYNPVGVEIGSWNYFYTKAPLVYTPKVIEKGFEILDRADKKARMGKEDWQVRLNAIDRVAFLRKGLTNANLTLAAQRAYETGDKYKLAKAVQELDEFRASIEGDFIAEMHHLVQWENVCWDRTSLEFMLNAPGEPLKDKWLFAFDPNAKGEAEGWFAPSFDDSKWESIGVDSGWEMQDVGKRWRDAHNGADYDGIGWYRFKIEVPEKKIGMNALLTIGAADEACKIWVNGKLALDRPYPYQGDGNSWATPFEVDITDFMSADGHDTIAIKVVDTAGQGGIWRPVYLKFTPKTGGNLILNPSFEERNATSSNWPSHAPHGKFKHGFVTENPHSGKQCYKMTCTEINKNGVNRFEVAWMRVFQPVTITKPGKYYFSAWFKNDPDYKGLVHIWVLGTGVKKEFHAGSTGGVWKQMEFPEFEIPAGTDKVTVYLNVLGALGNIYFDDVQLSPIE